jgi:hypothetical protein
MIKSTLLGGALAIILSSNFAMAADDFHALSVIQAAPMQDEALASTEGGSICSTPNATTAVNNGAPGGGVSLCSSLGSVAKGAFHSVSNQLPVTGANFLQVIGWLP